MHKFANSQFLAPIVLLLSAPAAGQIINAGQQRLEIVGTAPSACVLLAPTAANGINASFQSEGPANGEIRITRMVDPLTAEPVASSIDLLLPVICNSAHRMQVRSLNGGMLRDGGNQRNRQGGDSFGEFVGYQLSVDWADQSISSPSANGGGLRVDSARGRAGEVALSFEMPAGGGPLVAGRYSDSVVIEFQAAN